MRIKINITGDSGNHTITAVLADNSSAEAFAELLSKGPVSVDMEDYGSFEKVGTLPVSLPRNDRSITTVPGDLILYQGNKITIYYNTNSWSFTRLGKVEGVTKVRYSEGIIFSKELYEYEILRMLGGRAALDVIKGVTDMGANRDITKVVDLVSELFDTLCIHGFDLHDDINTPEAFYAKRTYLISCEIEKYYQRARRILIENRDFLLAVTDALLEKQTLTCRDIGDIRSSLAH